MSETAPHAPNLPAGDFDPLTVARQHAEKNDAQTEFERQWLGMHDGGTPPIGETARVATQDEVVAAAKDVVKLFESQPESAPAPDHTYNGYRAQTTAEGALKGISNKDLYHAESTGKDSVEEADKLQEASLDNLMEQWAAAKRGEDRTTAYPIEQEVKRRVFKDVPEHDPKYNEATRRDQRLEKAEQRLGMITDRVERMAHEPSAPSQIDRMSDAEIRDLSQGVATADKSAIEFMNDLSASEINTYFKRKEALAADEPVSPTPTAPESTVSDEDQSEPDHDEPWMGTRRSDGGNPDATSAPTVRVEHVNPSGTRAHDPGPDALRDGLGAHMDPLDPLAGAPAEGSAYGPAHPDDELIEERVSPPYGREAWPPTSSSSGTEAPVSSLDDLPQDGGEGYPTLDDFVASRPDLYSPVEGPPYTPEATEPETRGQGRHRRTPGILRLFGVDYRRNAVPPSPSEGMSSIQDREYGPEDFARIADADRRHPVKEWYDGDEDANGRSRRSLWRSLGGRVSRLLGGTDSSTEAAPDGAEHVQAMDERDASEQAPVSQEQVQQALDDLRQGSAPAGRAAPYRPEQGRPPVRRNDGVDFLDEILDGQN
jgi:hypothetical protein